MESQTVPQPVPQTVDPGWKGRVALLLTGQAFSLLGSSIVQYAIWWWIVLQEQSGSALLMATLFGVLPQGVVSIFGGSWADRHNRKLLIMLPDLLIAGVTVLLSIAFAKGWASLGFIFVVLFIRSAGSGVQSPAVQSFIPDVTPTGRLLRVNSIFSVINSANMIAAPAVAAVLINVVPLWSILLVDVTTAVIGVGFVALIKPPRKAVTTAAGNAETAPTGQTDDKSIAASVRRAFADLRAGFAYVMGRARLKAVILSDAMVCLISVAPMNLTLLLMAREYEGVDLDLWFVNLTTASDKLAANELGWSIGMLLGGAFMSSVGARIIRNPMRVAAWGVVAYAVTVVGLGVAPGLLAYLIADVLNGIASAVCVGPMRTILQSESDESMTGRVFGLDTTLATFAMPLGMAVFAPLADVVSIALIFVVAGVLTLPVGAWLLVQDRRTRRPAVSGS
ncbi:MFS transporter [Bifidobacterium avesanii]|nr:MFS transporter [Bifidobacterium avesanii]KAB8295669.1 MFS transporter [Bifidobacterium avesanii]